MWEFDTIASLEKNIITGEYTAIVIVCFRDEETYDTIEYRTFKFKYDQIPSYAWIIEEAGIELDFLNGNQEG